MQNRMKNLIFSILLLTAMSCVYSICEADPKSNLKDGLYAEMNTNKGTIIIELYYQKTPLTVANFVGLAEGSIKSNKGLGKPFYDGIVFHRVINNFMVQGGDPDGSGRGGPGYKFPDEFDSSLKHDSPGILSMANSGPNTNGSQFFITHVPTPWLDNKHTVFGKVMSGMDVVNKIIKGDRIKKLKILRIGKKAESFKTGQAEFEKLKIAYFENIEFQKREVLKKHERRILEKWPKLKKTPSGLRYMVTKEGSGPKPKKGTRIKAHYKGTLLNGEKFDSSYDRDKPFIFNVGTGRVIPGWDEAFLDMRKNEKRTLIIPPNLGYGKRGFPPVIPPNATLIFEVELIGF